jgi:uncharacterized protein
LNPVQVGSSPEGALITVRVRPRSKPGIELVDGQLVVRVMSLPHKGRATDEARRALADAVGMAPSRVRLVRGGRSREKVFLATQVDPGEVASRLAIAFGRADQP